MGRHHFLFGSLRLRTTHSLPCIRPFPSLPIVSASLSSRISDRSNSSVAGHASPSLSLLAELKERGLVESVTGAEGSLESFVNANTTVAYAGVDPTATSLHVGHLLPLMNLLHFYLRGHHSIALIGKATASVGDPSGRSTERDSMEAERLKTQFNSIWKQIGQFFERGREYALERGYSEQNAGQYELTTNGDWLGGLGLVEFLSTVGRHVRVSQMLARESVKARMESTQGINFAEFTYQLLQSYDFWHLYRNKGCKLQIGGNDQYGNITAGIDLITRLVKSSSMPPKDDQDLAYGLTVPLLTTSSGQKFGKSAGNAVWLDNNLTSAFDLYQYFVRLPDDAVEKYLKMFTLLPISSITDTIALHRQHPEKRAAQHLLAQEVVTLIHGTPAATRAAIQTKLLFPSQSGERTVFSANEILNAFAGDVGLVEVPREEVLNQTFTKVMRDIGVMKTKTEADKLVKAGGVYVGQEGMRVTDHKTQVVQEWLLDDEVFIFRIGKSRFHIVKLL